VEFGGRLAPMEIQAKHGLQGGTKTVEAFEAIRDRTSSWGGPEVFLVVDPTASGKVRDELGEDLDRVRSGRMDELKTTAQSLADLGAPMVEAMKKVHVRTEPYRLGGRANSSRGYADGTTESEWP
jgi:hypothetical protein